MFGDPFPDIAMRFLPGTAAAAVLFGCAAPPVDKPAIDMAWHDTTVAVGSGDSIHAVYRGIAQGRVLVFIPGLADTWQSYNELAAALPDSFGMVLIDALGHGSSTKRPGSIRAARQADAVRALLDSLEIRPFAVIGHSYGGLIAQHYGARNPDLPAAILMATMMTMKGTPEAPAWSGLAASLTDSVPDEILAGQRESFFGPVADSVVERYISASRLSPGHVWKEAIAEVVENDSRPMLADWKPRTLVVFAEHDKVLNGARTLELAAALPQADTVRIPRTSHAMHWERPDTVAVELLAFFATVGISQ
jgi:3-oxoadipate enol-lactonase